MSYVDQRLVYDADSHVMELPDCLEEFSDDATRQRLRPMRLGAAGALADNAVARAVERREAGADSLPTDPHELLRSKGWDAIGAFDRRERSAVLDALGFAAQWVFPTFAGVRFAGGDLDLLYGGTDALNRSQAAFCADDPRLLAVGVIPWADPARTVTAARRAIDEGCKAIQVPSDLRNGVVSPTHPDHDELWALLEESNTPVVTHIGGGGQPVRRGFHDNGRPVTDFLGGGENIRSKDYMAIHQRTEVFWAALVFDGILERHPGLRGASIEEGAMWVVPWIRRLDLAMTFAKTEPTLRDLPMAPSEYVRRQLRFTPFPAEPVGWMQEQAGAELFLFSSDYPHPEGTKDPVARFEATMPEADEAIRERFYAGNFRDLYRGAVPV
ncbi:MAG TPA: amidohydrolase family protein [Acidimicrobiales bacterium]